ncbi:hypothetical protein [Lactococcus petauri]|uniref:Uncharacterized protein n=1 Tax=Lactococcus petauri TaxID=1940789 RepID=A0A252CF98_9LACT|nr:hypothetical protein [Lactococcus petauri]OUK05203.1 hypothetical protein BZZ03_00350 [Lactococcus petauri]
MENLKEQAIALKEQFEEMYSEIGYSIQEPNGNPASGWQGYPLISIWDYSSNFEAGFCLKNNLLKRVY